jgi:cytochrome P450
VTTLPPGADSATPENPAHGGAVPQHPQGVPGGAVPPPGCPAHQPSTASAGAGAESAGQATGDLRGRAARRLYGPEVEADPKPLYDALRAEHGTVAPVLVHGDLPAWLVLGHRENLDVLRTPTRFSRDSRRWREMREGRVPPDSPLLPIVTWQPMCPFVDGQEHKRLRSAVTDSMNRFEARGVRRYVTRFSHELVDTFCAAGEAEIVGQFAEHLPMMVMTQLLGMPEEYGDRLVAAARDMVRGSKTAIASNDYIVAILGRLAERRRAAPQHDFASWLVAHPAGLGHNEVVEHLRLMLIAAYETTANLIASTLRMVLTDPRFRANLAGGHMTLPDAVEQVLWDEPPFTAVYGRWATGDTELGGQHIREGDMLIVGIEAGNTDPEVRPDLTVPMHGNRSHLAFSGGPHECPGQDIGRAIADTGIDTLLARLPDLRLAVPEQRLQRRGGLLSRHLISLPVEFTPQRPDPSLSALPSPSASARRPVPPPATGAVPHSASAAPAVASALVPAAATVPAGPTAPAPGTPSVPAAGPQPPGPAPVPGPRRAHGRPRRSWWRDAWRAVRGGH